MSDGRITKLLWLGIIGVNIGMWYSIWNYGLLTTLLPVVGLSIIGALIIKLRENR